MSTPVTEIPVFIFYHICLYGPWKAVVQDQVQKIKDSGLLDVARNFYYGVLGPASEINELKALMPEKAELILHSEDFSLFEFPTLIALQEHAALNDGNYLYLHTKSVTRFNDCTTDWRLFMDHFAITKYKTSIEALGLGYDCTGVNWHESPFKHFSGNFWWASSGYIRKLNKLLTGPDRFVCEKFIGTGNPRAFCHFESGINHYYVRFPKERYMTD